MTEPFTRSPDEQLDTVNEQVRLIRRKSGLTFGTDAFLLAAFVRPQPRAAAVDLGSGTGILPLLLCAKNKVKTVLAAELQPEYAGLCRRNAALNGMSDRITVWNGDVRALNLQICGGEVGLVISNPPYLRPGSGRSNRHTEKEIARHEVAGGIGDFCAAAGRILRTGGRFCVVWKPERLPELFAAMRANRLEPKRMTVVHADASREPCAILAEAVRDGLPDLRITPPLFLYEPNTSPTGTRVLTAEAKKIYDTCEWMGENRRNTVLMDSNKTKEIQP